MYSITDLKKGLTIELSGAPFLILDSQHSKLGRGGGMMWTKLKNLESGEIIERNFKGNEKIKEAVLESRKAQYLYREGENYFFMDTSSFEQFSLKAKQVQDKIKFIKEGEVIEIIYFAKKPINLSIPIKVNLRVVKTEPGLRGDRETSGTKPAVTENGVVVQVPLFIKEGDLVCIDTRTGSYVTRVKE